MLDPAVIITILTGLAAAVGGFMSGRQVTAVQKATIESQSAGLDALRLRIDEQDRIINMTIPELRSRIVILEDLVTRRADVDRVIEVVEQIQERINAAPW